MRETESDQLRRYVGSVRAALDEFGVACALGWIFRRIVRRSANQRDVEVDIARRGGVNEHTNDAVNHCSALAGGAGNRTGTRADASTAAGL